MWGGVALGEEGEAGGHPLDGLEPSEAPEQLCGPREEPSAAPVHPGSQAHLARFALLAYPLWHPGIPSDQLPTFQAEGGEVGGSPSKGRGGGGGVWTDG